MAKDQQDEHRRPNNKKRRYQGETHKYHQSSWPQEQRSYQRRFTASQNQQKRFYPSHPIYYNAFYGYCFKCSQYGHKATRCKSSVMNRDLIRKRSFMYMPNDNLQCIRCHWYGHREANCIANIRSNNYSGRGLYAPQIEQDVQCLNCNAYGHIARFYRKPFSSDRW